MKYQHEIPEHQYQKELNRIYKELGYKIIERIEGPKNKLFDVLLEIDGEEKRIEEKALSYYHKKCPIELIQSIWPFDSGWLYETKADYLHYLYYQDLMPIVLYQVSMKRLVNKLKINKSHSFFINQDWKKYISSGIAPEKSEHTGNSSYGNTLNLYIEWNYLLKMACAKTLKKWPKVER